MDKLNENVDKVKKEITQYYEDNKNQKKRK